MNLFENLQEQEIEKRVNQEIEKRLKNPDYIIEAYQKSLETAKRQIIEMKPKAEYYDIVVSSESLFEMSSVAKILNFKNMGRNKIFEFLRDQNILRANNEPFQTAEKAGYFKLIAQTFNVDNQIKTGFKTMITQKGLDYIMRKLLEEGYELNTSN